MVGAECLLSDVVRSLKTPGNERRLVFGEVRAGAGERSELVLHWEDAASRCLTFLVRREFGGGLLPHGKQRCRIGSLKRCSIISAISRRFSSNVMSVREMP